MYVIRITEKEAVNLKKSREGYMGGLGGKKGRGNVVIIISKIKIKKVVSIRYSNSVASGICFWAQVAHSESWKRKPGRCTH